MEEMCDSRISPPKTLNMVAYHGLRPLSNQPDCVNKVGARWIIST